MIPDFFISFLKKVILRNLKTTKYKAKLPSMQRGCFAVKFLELIFRNNFFIFNFSKMCL